MTMRLVSGSPVANEAYDMNVGLMNADGRLHRDRRLHLDPRAGSERHTVKDIKRDYSDDPGIDPGDVFMCNDPYVGACHQMDIMVVAPIFFGDELVGWTGLHGPPDRPRRPRRGPGADRRTSIWGEQPIFPPLKIVDRRRASPRRQSAGTCGGPGCRP